MLTFFIFDQEQGRNDQLIDIIDTIIRYVQGDYITFFQEKIGFLFPLIWQKTNNGGAGHRELLIKLLKIFKIWDLFFAKETLN